MSNEESDIFKVRETKNIDKNTIYFPSQTAPQPVSASSIVGNEYLHYDPVELGEIKQLINTLIKLCETKKTESRTKQNQMLQKVYTSVKKAGAKYPTNKNIDKTIELLKQLLKELEDIEKIIKKYQTDTPVPTTTAPPATTTPKPTFDPYKKSAEDTSHQVTTKPAESTTKQTTKQTKKQTKKPTYTTKKKVVPTTKPVKTTTPVPTTTTPVATTTPMPTVTVTQAPTTVPTTAPTMPTTTPVNPQPQPTSRNIYVEETPVVTEAQTTEAIKIEEDVIKPGNTYKLPTSSKMSQPTSTTDGKGNSAIPVLAGLAAAAAAGVGAKAYIDRKNNRDNEEGDEFKAEDWSGNNEVNIEYQEPVGDTAESLDYDDTGYEEEVPEKYGARTQDDMENLQ